MNNCKEAKKSIENATDMLAKIVSTESRVAMLSYVAMTFHQLGSGDQAILLLNKEIQQLQFQCHPVTKVPCLMALGKIYYLKNQTVEAETHYNEVLEILSDHPNGNTLEILECLLEASDILTGNGKPLEGRKKLEDARKYLSSLNNVKEKCNILKELGERWERFGEIHLAISCHNDALRLCKATALKTNIPYTEISLELKLGDLCQKENVGRNTKEYESFASKSERLAAQRNHYERAGFLLQQYSDGTKADYGLIELFYILALKFASVDLEKMEKHLLQALKISDVLYGPVTGNDTISTILFGLYSCYMTKGDLTSAVDVVERSLRIEMDQHSSDSFHAHICHRLFFFSWLHFLKLPSCKVTAELLADFFQNGLKDEEFINSAVTVSKANAAHCFTLLSVIFWCYREFERAQSFNNIALQLFEKIKERGIPQNRSSSHIICCKLKKVLEQPNNQLAVVKLSNFFLLQSMNENNVWGFLYGYNTRNKLRNVFDSVFPTFFNEEGVDMLSFLPQFISLYDQYSSHLDADSSPYLTFNMELLRQLSTHVYGEHPAIDGKKMSLTDLLNLLPFATNVISSVITGSGPSVIERVQEALARTNYGAVIDHNPENLLTTSCNTVSSLLSNAESNKSSPFSSLLSAVDKRNVENSHDTVSQSIQPKMSETLHRDEVSDPQPTLSSRDSVAEIYRGDEDTDSVLAPNNGKKRAVENFSMITSTSEKDLEEKRNNGGRKTENLGVDAEKGENNDSFRPSLFAVEIFRRMMGNVFGKKTDSSSILGKKGVGTEPNVAAESICSSNIVRQGEDESLPEMETFIDSLLQEYEQAPSGTTTHSLSQLNYLKCPETCLVVKKSLQRKCEALETIPPALSNLHDSAMQFLKDGELQQYVETNNKIDKLIKSFVKIAPKSYLIEKCLTIAENDLKNYKVDSAKIMLNLAAQFPRGARQDARILKLRGDCFLLEGSYRLAAINFTRVVNYYSNGILDETAGILVFLQTSVGLIKAHILCQNLQDALRFCQEAIAVVTQPKPNEIITLRTMELCYLSAKCLLSTMMTDDVVKKASSFCQQGLAASKVFGEKINSSEATECLGKNGEFFKLTCKLQLLYAKILQQLNKVEDAREILNDFKTFLLNISNGFEAFTASAWEGGKRQFYIISFRLFASIGHTFLINGELNSAINWFTKSLSAFFAADELEATSLHEDFLPLLNAITDTNIALSPGDRNSFEQTVDMCKQEILKANGNVNKVYEFMFLLGLSYVEAQRTSETIVVYKTALAAAECLSDSVKDQRKRAILQLHLGHAHRMHSVKNTGTGRKEERSLARKYYESGEDKDLHFSTLCKKLSLTCWLLEESELTEANGLLQELLKLGDKLANIPVPFGYYSRYFYGPVMKDYIEKNGKCTTTLACLVYSVAFLIYLGLGKTKEAVVACENLSTQRDLGTSLSFSLQPPLTSHLLSDCHRKLSVLVNDQTLQNCDFPLSPVNLAKLYYELKEYELVIKYCSEAVHSVKENQLSDKSNVNMVCMRILGNTLIETGKHDQCFSYFSSFLEILHKEREILDLEFDEQCAVLDEYTFADRFYIMRSLGILCVERGRLDCAIKCYERCLEEDANLQSHQSLVGTLAELYQSKALVAKDNALNSRWMKLADELYKRLFRTTTTVHPFVESSYGLYLCKIDCHFEAIDHFVKVIKNPEDCEISFADEDKPLLDAHLAREIDVRTSITLPLKVFAYHQLCTAYLKTNEMEKAHESALAMEKYVSNLELNTDDKYPLVLSVVAYTYKLIGNKEKATKLFCSVLEKIPNHPPVVEALECFFLDLD